MFTTCCVVSAPPLVLAQLAYHRSARVSLECGTRYHTARIAGDRIHPNKWFQKGWQLTSPAQTFLTFTRATPEDRPRHKRLGLDRVGDDALQRWAAERYRFAPYQLSTANCVVKDGTLRTLNAEEREVIMGFPYGAH
jgi:hypothetical protein